MNKNRHMKQDRNCRQRDILLVVLCLSWLTGLSAQPRETLFKELTIHQGLSQNTVNALHQDHLGFVWIGTDDGLNRYDGYQIITYYMDPADSTTLSNSSILSLCQCSNHTLWIGTANGLNRYQPESNSFKRYSSLDTRIKKSDRNYILSVYHDINGQVWAGTLEGLYKYQTTTDTFLACTLLINGEEELGPIPIYTIGQDSSGTVIIGTGGAGLFSCIAISDTGAVVHLEPIIAEPLSKSYIVNLTTTNDGTVWFISDWFELHSYHPQTGRHRSYTSGNNHYFSGNPQLQCLFQTEIGHMLIGTYDQGIYFFHPENGSLARMKIHSDGSDLLNTSNVRVISQDMQGSLWLGLGSQGVRIVAEKRSEIQLYQHQPEDNTTLASNEIFAVAEDSNGTIWIGSNKGGVDLFHRDHGVMKHYRPVPGESNSLIHTNVWSILIDSRGESWIGTDFGLDRFDPRRNRFRHYTPRSQKGQSLSAALVLCLAEDRENNIWIGTNGGGLNIYERATDTVIHTTRLDTTNHLYFPDEFITALHRDTAGNIWIGSFNGLSKFDYARKRFEHFNIEQYPFMKNSVNAIYDDGRGRIWLGSAYGLSFYRLSDSTFTNYTMHDGLPNNIVNAILSDDHGNIWFTTNQGLSKYDPLEQHFINYQPADGLQSTEFNVGASLKSSTGWLYFGGLYGLNVFHPDSLHTDSYTFPLQITELEILDPDIPRGTSDAVITSRMLTEQDTLNLTWRQNTFSLRFAALDYTNPARIRYTYRLKGFQEAWVDIGERHLINFTNLPPGEYRFDVHASDGSGVWITDITSMTIIIKKAFWQTLLFRLLIVSLLLLLLYLGLKMRIRHVHRRNRRLKKIVQHRTKKLNQQRSELAEKNLRLQIEIKRRKEVEDTLRIEEEKYRTFIEQTHEGIFRVDFEKPVPVSLPVDEQLALFYKYGYVGECNHSLAVMYGYSSTDDLVGVRLVTLHGGDDNKKNLQGQADFINSGYRMLNVVTEEKDLHDERQVFNNNAVGVVDNGHLVYIWGTQENISDRIKAEESIRKSLQEKEVLLKEIHHRVKNNLAVISSLLNLQARHIDDHDVKELFRESQSRVTSMARIHEKIYQSDDLAHIDFANYITSTTQNLFSLYNINRTSIDLDITVSKVELAVDTAVPCGLILNELVSNSLKYAFPPKFEGKAVIKISMKYLDDGDVELIVQDNGVGIPAHIALKNAESLGLKLIYILAEEQLDGTVTVDQKQGTKFRITFTP